MILNRAAFHNFPKLEAFSLYNQLICVYQIFLNGTVVDPVFKNSSSHCDIK